MNFHSDCAVNEIKDLPVGESEFAWLPEGNTHICIILCALAWFGSSNGYFNVARSDEFAITQNLLERKIAICSVSRFDMVGGTDEPY